MNKTKFSDRLKSIREMSGLSQKQLADKCGLCASNISHFEAGRREPGLENLTRIVLALGVSADVLLGTARP